MKRVTFESGHVSVVGNLHTPSDFDDSQRYPAIIIATPGSSVKEQIGAIYAERLAARGNVALTFDPSFQGESGGEPRDLEDPAARVRDIHCAVDHLMTLRFVDEERLGLLGICAGGGYAIKAAQTERRFKAVGTVVANDIGEATRRLLPDFRKTLVEVAQQRTSEARGGKERRDPWIPDTLQQAKDAGIDDPELLEAVKFYRESQYRHPNSTNRLLFVSYGSLLGFDAFGLVPDLLTQPLQVIVGGRRGATGQYEAGQRLFDLSPAKDKNLLSIEGAGHYDLYHKPEYVDQAIKRLAAFFAQHIGSEVRA